MTKLKKLILFLFLLFSDAVVMWFSFRTFTVPFLGWEVPYMAVGIPLTFLLTYWYYTEIRHIIREVVR